MTLSNSKPTVTQRWDDPAMLLPAFRARVEMVMRRLVAMDLDPVLHETFRSKERAAMLVASGKSKAKGGLSMHCYGVAADVICKHHKWSCHEHACTFFQQLGEQAQKCGLTWGGDWDWNPATNDGWDKPHLQAVPVAKQRFIRSAKDQAEREAACIAFMGEVVP